MPTFRAIRTSMASSITAMTPSYLPHFKFKESHEANGLNAHPVDASLLRVFEIESGGIEGGPSTMNTSINRDTQKRCTIRVAYPISDNQREIRDMADSDEYQIVHYFELPANIATIGAWNCRLENSNHVITDGRRITEINLLIHYLNPAP